MADMKVDFMVVRGRGPLVRWSGGPRSRGPTAPRLLVSIYEHCTVVGFINDFLQFLLFIGATSHPHRCDENRGGGGQRGQTKDI